MLLKDEVGSKYFRFINESDEKPEIIRIVGIVNEDKVSVLFEDGTRKKIRYSELIRYYNRLKPDGKICISIAKISDDTSVRDIIVTFNKYSDIEKGVGVPTIACRQNISDIYANMVTDRSGIQRVGCTATPYTMPEEIPYDIMFACEAVEEFNFYNTYLDDTLDTFIQCVKTKKYDSILEELFYDTIKLYPQNLKTKCIQDKCNVGFMTTLYDLLSINAFFTEYYLAFDIVKVGFDITTDECGNLNNLAVINKLDLIFECVFTGMTAIKYAKDIDLSKIYEGRYILIRDNSDILYILSYTADRIINTKNVNFTEIFKDMKNKSSQ